MRKYIFALLLGISLMAAQSASAATLSLGGSLGLTPDVSGPGSFVSGSGTGSIQVELTTNSNEFVNLFFSFTNVSSFSFLPATVGGGTVNSNGLFGGGSYLLTMIGTGAASSFGVNLEPEFVPEPGSEVPVPAAIWLFGSALMGLLGVSRRKSQPTLAA